MGKKEYALHWEVPNYDINRRALRQFNIFDNSLVHDSFGALLKKYKRRELDFGHLCEGFRKDLMWQEWSRVEYEIGLAEDNGTAEDAIKIDAYSMALLNIRFIVGAALLENGLAPENEEFSNSLSVLTFREGDVSTKNIIDLLHPSKWFPGSRTVEDVKSRFLEEIRQLKSERMTVFELYGKAVGKISEYDQLAWNAREIINVFAWKNGYLFTRAGKIRRMER